MKFNIFIDTEKDVINDFFYITKFKHDVYYGDTLEEIKEKISDEMLSSKAIDVNDGNNAERIEIIKEEINDFIKQDNLEKIEVVFKQPDFNTSSFILEKSMRAEGSLEQLQIDFIMYTKLRLHLLLKDWNLEENGKKVEVSPENISRLHPSIVEAINQKLNKNIKNYRVA
jgi:hypothetical protein